jgi:hypothetical protein
MPPQNVGCADDSRDIDSTPVKISIKKKNIKQTEKKSDLTTAKGNLAEF